MGLSWTYYGDEPLGVFLIKPKELGYYLTWEIGQLIGRFYAMFRYLVGEFFVVDVTKGSVGP